MKRESRVFLERVLFGQYVMTAALLPPFAKVTLAQSASFSMRRCPIWGAPNTQFSMRKVTSANMGHERR
jgi:hypothetical protein